MALDSFLVRGELVGLLPLCVRGDWARPCKCPRRQWPAAFVEVVRGYQDDALVTVGRGSPEAARDLIGRQQVMRHGDPCHFNGRLALRALRFDRREERRRV